MNKVHIIHGIHSSEGDASTPARCIPELKEAGYEIEVHEYGYAYALSSRWKNKARAESIAPKIGKHDFILAHSNGCDITRRMLDMGIIIKGAVLLQPALDEDTKFAPGGYWINVFHNDHDNPTLFAKYFLWFGHPWGAMGRFGYSGNDTRIRNHDTLREFGLGGHSRPYTYSNLRERVVQSIKEREHQYHGEG